MVYGNMYITIVATSRYAYVDHAREIDQQFFGYLKFKLKELKVSTSVKNSGTRIAIESDQTASSRVPAYLYNG